MVCWLATLIGGKIFQKSVDFVNKKGAFSFLSYVAFTVKRGWWRQSGAIYANNERPEGQEDGHRRAVLLSYA